MFIMRQLELMKSELIKTKILFHFCPSPPDSFKLSCVLFTGLFSAIDAMSVHVEDVGMKNINLHSLYVS